MMVVNKKQTWWRVYTGGLKVFPIETYRSNKGGLWVIGEDKPIKKDCVYWNHYESELVALARMVVMHEKEVENAEFHLKRAKKNLLKAKSIAN